MEIVSDAIAISLSYHPEKLALLLARIAVCDEMLKQLDRRNPGQRLELREVGPDINLNGLHDRINMEYELVWYDEKGNSESVPIRYWARLAKKLGLSPSGTRADRMRKAWAAEEFLWYLTANKLAYVLRQFLFESLHAATGELVNEDKRRYLEQMGSLVGRCGELQPVDEYSPADLRKGPKEALEAELYGKINTVNTQRTPTYDSVAAEMQSFFRFVPALTGETLRKVVKHHGIDWKGLKAEAAPRRKRKRKASE
jgi:hypothetical protein